MPAIELRCPTAIDPMEGMLNRILNMRASDIR